MFKPVKEGDIFKPNAELTNETIKIISSHNTLGGGKVPKSRKNATNIEILVCPYASLQVFSPVRIVGLNSATLTDANLFSKRAYAAEIPNDTNKDYPLAILQNTGFDNDNLIKALLIGTTPAKVNISDSDHQYCDTNDDGDLISVSSGPVRILHKPAETGEKWCTLLLGGGGESGDKGYCKVIQTAANKIKVIDGADPEAVNCWSGYINKLKKDIPVSAELTLTEDCIIYLESVAVGDPVTSFTTTFKQAETLPDHVNGTKCSLVSRIKFKAPVAPETIGTITEMIPEPVPNHIIVWGSC